MFTEGDLRKLLEFKPDHPVLSVFLNTDPAEGSADVYKLKLRTILKDIELTAEKEAIEKYFDLEYDWNGRSVVIFACDPEDFFEAYTFALPIRTRARIHNRPHVKPLINLIDFYGHYGIALVDKQGVRLFSYHLGRLEEDEQFSGENVRQTKHGGGSQSAGRRSSVGNGSEHADEVADRNVRQSAELAAKYFHSKDIRRIVIGGTDENITVFRNQLPKTWQSLVVGEFPISKSASKEDIIERAKTAGLKSEKLKESKIVNTVITGAAKGQGAVTGAEGTLKSLQEGRLQTLVIDVDYRQSGFRCVDCSYLTTEQLDECTYCGGNLEEIPDVINLAVRRVLESGGEIEVLQYEPNLADHGHIGGILRY